MIPQLIIALALAAVCGFFCLLLWRVSEQVRNYRAPAARGRIAARPSQPALTPENVEEFGEKVAALTPIECPNCGTSHMPDKKICENCGYAPPISVRTARRSFTSIRRNLENPDNPPNLRKQQKTS